jgi:hypothetical protein
MCDATLKDEAYRGLSFLVEQGGVFISSRNKLDEFQV